MTFIIIQLVISLAAILGAAMLFTNAVEILGDRLELGGGAVGSVLAAVGTALPETMIPLVAIILSLITGGSGTSEISIGAIVGAPFLLMTLGMFVIGAAALGFKGRRESGAEVSIDKGVAGRDTGYFLVFFALAGAAGFLPVPFFAKVGLAVVLVGAYAYHVYQILEGGGEQEESSSSLLLWPSSRGEAPTWAVLAQVVVPIVVMAAGAHYFVQSVEYISREVGVPAGLISLILAPLATELPEKFNSAYWLRDSKDTLAFGNVSGATVFQGAVPVSLGLIFTPWNLDFRSGLAVVLALVAGVVLFLMLKSRKPLRGSYLLGGGVMYVAFIVVAVLSVVYS